MHACLNWCSVLHTSTFPVGTGIAVTAQDIILHTEIERIEDIDLVNACLQSGSFLTLPQSRTLWAHLSELCIVTSANSEIMYVCMYRLTLPMRTCRLMTMTVTP